MIVSRGRRRISKNETDMLTSSGGFIWVWTESEVWPGVAPNAPPNQNLSISKRIILNYMNISQTYRPVSRPTAPRNKIHASLSSHARQLCVIGRPNQCKNINWGPRKYPSWDLHAIIEPAGSTAGPAFVTWSDKDRELLWEAVPRPLLKLGQAGAQETHVRYWKQVMHECM